MALIHKILVPTDFSDGAKRALEYAAELSARFSAPVLLMHVYTSPSIPVPDGFVMMTPTSMANMMAQLETGLSQARELARTLGIQQIDTALVEGTAWHEIVHTARDHLCDLIIMGTHGRGGISHFLLGSTAEKVVRHADCPVLTISQRIKHAA